MTPQEYDKYAKEYLKAVDEARAALVDDTVLPDGYVYGNDEYLSDLEKIISEEKSSIKAEYKDLYRNRGTPVTEDKTVEYHSMLDDLADFAGVVAEFASKIFS